MNNTDYDKLKLALQRLEERYNEYLQHQKELPEYLLESVKESCIQRFETCFDTTWKHLKKYLEEHEGLADVPSSPNGVFKKAFSAQVIDDVNLWTDFNQKRGDTSHDYSGDKAETTFAVIADFITEAVELYEKMVGEPWQK
jgi:nucleotidyltransferase substrate binding protein (TIGR01987 family)